MTMSNAEKQHYGIGELADMFGVQSWRIARLFETGTLPEPMRVAGRRVIPITDAPQIERALRARGWLSSGFTLPDSTGLTVAQQEICEEVAKMDRKTLEQFVVGVSELLYLDPETDNLQTRPVDDTDQFTSDVIELANQVGLWRRLNGLSP